MKTETRDRIHLMQSTCKNIGADWFKKKADEYILSKGGKVITYNAGTNKCFWHSDNVWGAVSDIEQFIKNEFK